MQAHADFLILNSKHKTANSVGTHDFTIELKNSIQGRYKVNACVIPNTFYNINSYCNVLYFDDGTPRSVTITPSNYSASTLATAIQTALNASGSSITFTVTQSSATNKMTIAGDSAFTLKFGTNTTNSIAKRIGFIDADTSSALSHVGTNVIDIAYPRMVFVDINQRPNVASSGNGTGTMVFPIESSSSDLSIFKSESSFEMYIDFELTNIIECKIRDDDNKPLDLNGADWFIQLQKCKWT